MNYKNNNGFFTKTDMPKYIGIALVLLGVALFYFGWGRLAYLALCISLPLGIVLFIFGSSRRSSDADIDSCIETAMRDIDPKLELDRKYEKRLKSRIEKTTCEGYIFSDGVMLAKGKDGSLRSSEYKGCVIYPMTDGVYIKSRHFSLVEDKLCEQTEELHFPEIEKIELVREKIEIPFNKKNFTAPLCVLRIKHAGGVFETPIKDSISSEEFAEKLEKARASFSL